VALAGVALKTFGGDLEKNSRQVAKTWQQRKAA
jgi:hypothetical protein